MSKMNRAVLKLNYGGGSISTDVSPYVEDFIYTDHEGGKADDLQVTLSDHKHLWKGAWFPEKGATLTASISTEFHEGQGLLKCGTFAIDEISLSGPGDIVRLKAVSSFTARALKRDKKSRKWEGKTLKQIAGAIAGEHGLSLFWKGPDTPAYQRTDQREESDLAFLQRMCEAHDLNLKVSDNKMIICASATLEGVGPVWSLTRGDSCIGSFEFNTKTFEIYRACQVDYWDVEKKKLITYTFTAPDAPPVGQTLKANKRMESLGDAMNKAKAMLRRKNRQEITGSFDLMGDTVLLSGLTGTISGFGIFDGKYIIQQADHSDNRQAGYRTKINIRKTLSW